MGRNSLIKGEKRLGASPNRFPGCVLEVVCSIRCTGVKKVSLGYKKNISKSI